MSTIQPVTSNVASPIAAQTEQAAQTTSSPSEDPLLSGNSVTVTSAPPRSTDELMGGGDTTSLQFMFAKLQLELAEAAKTSALDKMAEIEKAQAERKKLAACIAEAKTTLEQKKNDPKVLDAEMKALMQRHQVTYKTGDSGDVAADWKLAIVDLEGRMVALDSNTQQMMAYVKDFMGQYNSYLQGADSQARQAEEMLSMLARGGNPPRQNSELAQTIEENRQTIV